MPVTEKTRKYANGHLEERSRKVQMGKIRIEKLKLLIRITNIIDDDKIMSQLRWNEHVQKIGKERSPKQIFSLAQNKKEARKELGRRSSEQNERKRSE